MTFYRFGQSGIRLDQVAAIRDVSAPASTGEPASFAVKVIFTGSGSEIFTGADAEALRAYVNDLPEPIAGDEPEEDITARASIQAGRRPTTAPRRPKRGGDAGKS